ncbi:MAG: aromatic ring-hydroxylating dioxygenase subunit alpha [Bacteroidota bacterium]|nr:aromatic ring-hydroxylating dioxygenase subunit alpha [Bacteroidota bacterium]
MSLFHINEDISLAETLPSEFYTNEKYFELSKDKIFSRTWQYAGDMEEARVAGQIHPFYLLENFLDEPLMLSRDKNDTLHCLSNVCTHRGNIIIEGNCIEKNIICRYHGRRFDLNGKFLLMPEFNEVKNFPSKTDNLPRIPFNTWQKFLFVSLNPISPVQHFIGEMCSRMSWLPLNEFVFDSSRSRDYLVKAHWALYCENYLEGFHIPYVHNSLSAALDYSSYKTELYKFSSLQTGVAKSGEDCFDFPKNSTDFGQKISAFYFWIFPNTMFNFYPWGLSINVIKPVKPDLSKVSFITYVWDESKLDKGAGAGLDKVEREDEAIVENVQRGINSRSYNRGRYSVKRETGTHHFHRLIAEFIS